jgi:hypothetical protein
MAGWQVCRERSCSTLKCPPRRSPPWLCLPSAHLPCVQTQTRGSRLQAISEMGRRGCQRYQCQIHPGSAARQLCGLGEKRSPGTRAQAAKLDSLVVLSYSTATCSTGPKGSNIWRSRSSVTVCRLERKGKQAGVRGARGVRWASGDPHARAERLLQSQPNVPAAVTCNAMPAVHAVPAVLTCDRLPT